MKRSRLLVLICLAVAGLFQNCRGGVPLSVYSANTTAPCVIILDASREGGRISPMLMGFNIVYNNAPDSVWRKGRGKIPLLLQQLGVGVLRYPGGTVTTFYHWEHPSGQGHKDRWDPSYDALKDKSPSRVMDLDEYIGICRELHTQPLIGINMGSGMKYGRVSEGIREALRLLKYCRQKGAAAKYFYLGNEPYQRDANYTFTAEDYAEMVNRYAAALKNFDHDIKIIVNTKPFWRNPSSADLSYTKTLILKAGKNIDFIDVHDYWAWGHATYALWQSEIPMKIGATGISYREQRKFYRALAASLGYPGIDMVSLEWNIGPPGQKHKPPTESQAALMIAEQFCQLIQSGMKMAAFWPVSWPSRTIWSSRALLDAQDHYAPNAVYQMFRLFRPVLGQAWVKAASSDTAVQVVGVKSMGADTLWIYLLNKRPIDQVTGIRLTVNGFSPQQVWAVGFNAEDNHTHTLRMDTVALKTGNGRDYMLAMKPYSLLKIVMTK